MRVGSSLLRPPFPLLPSSHCLRTTLNFLLDKEKQIPFTSYPNGIIKAKLGKCQGEDVSPIRKALFCQQNLGDSYWLLLKDIFWNFSPTRLKFALDVDLSASTTQQASGLFPGMLVFQLAISAHCGGSRPSHKITPLFPQLFTLTQLLKQKFSKCGFKEPGFRITQEA